MNRDEASRPSAAFRELFLFLSAIAALLWMPEGRLTPLVDGVAAGAAVLCLAASIRRRGGFERMSSRSKPSEGRPWLTTTLLTVVWVVAIVVAGALLRAPYEPTIWEAVRGPSFSFGTVVATQTGRALLQQVALLWFLLPLVAEGFRNTGIAIVVTAGLFALCHLPCPGLAVASGGLGLMWLLLFRRHHRLWPIVASHAVISTAAIVAIPSAWSCNLEVGLSARNHRPRYLELRKPSTRNLLTAVTSEAYFHAVGDRPASFVRALYRDMLGRNPSEAEVRGWVARIKQGSTRTTVALAFAGSREYLDRVKRYRKREAES